LELLDEGLSLNQVGRRIGCAPSSVMRWREKRRRGGQRALKVRFSPGRPPKLSAEQRRRLVKVLLKGAMANGYSTQLWTTLRIAEVVRKNFRVGYHRDHIGRLMHNLGWSHQKPEKRALERNEQEIERFRREVWPRVKKRCADGCPPRFPR
jgi:transposase